jgi:hypothetical protein
MYTLILLALPVVVLVALGGFIALAAIFLVCLLVLSCLLLGTAAVSLGGAIVLLAPLAALAAAATVPLIAMALGLIVFGLYLAGLVLLQWMVLLVVALMRPAQYLWVIRRGIHLTCPSGRHGTFTVPAHLCPDCGAAYSNLWPSTYGVLHHQCEGTKDGHPCHRRLPTLDRLGRNQLNRVCAKCGASFRSRSSGKLPVAVVGIVGGTSVGKTTMMLMTIAKLMSPPHDGSNGIRAEIDTDDQRAIFEREWGRLQRGEMVAPSSGSVPDAFILRLKHSQKQSLLYLYDAPGEQFQNIDTFSQHQYLQVAAGLLLLVDPASLPGFVEGSKSIAAEVQASQGSETAIAKVVNTCIAATQKMMPQTSDQRLGLPLAVIITKADMKAVTEQVGDITLGSPDSAVCTKALRSWRADSVVQMLEKNFSNVRYFACSALGRTPNKENTTPFTAYGVLDPLLWILDGSNHQH